MSLASPSLPVLPVLMVIPTGIGCAIGGYAGDALPSARLLAAASGCLITHPNVMNGASLYWSDPAIHYVEGYALDRFAAGDWHLRPVRQRRVGLLLDAGIEPELRYRQIQVAEACRATLGLEVGPVLCTDSPLGVILQLGSSGISLGRLDAPDVLLRAGERLRDAGATAVAIVAQLPDNNKDALLAYRQGQGVDVLAGVEAVISHLLVRHLQLPCAHAPALHPLALDLCLDPRAAAEELGYSFLACVLVGLSRAPDLVTNSATAHVSGLITADDLGAVVVPAGACGGEAAMSCLERGLPLIMVENPSLLQVTPQALGIYGRQLYTHSYAEAAGFLLALRHGIALEALQRPLSPLTTATISVGHSS